MTIYQPMIFYTLQCSHLWFLIMRIIWLSSLVKLQLTIQLTSTEYYIQRLTLSAHFPVKVLDLIINIV